MKKDRTLRHILVTVLLLFGALTLFLSTSVIFDLFDMRAREGNYVPVVVWANLAAGYLYVMGAYGLLARKRWTLNVLFMAVLVLVGAGIAFAWHVHSGGVYEQKTIGALTFRVLFSLALYIGAYRLVRSKKAPLTPNNMSMKFLLPATILSATLVTAGCGTVTNDDPATATHQADGAQADHTEESNVAEETPKVSLDNGNRWKANPETSTGIANMAATLRSFDATTGNADTLKAELLREFNLIFQRCTMQGEAHNQLHNYLIPMHQALNTFNGSDPHQRENMAAHLAQYATYFE